MRPIAVSGIRATGRMHLGNYIGAMRNFPALQEEHDCYFFVADYHTLTSLTNPDALRSNLLEIVMDYLAAGLDPERSVIFAQSSVPEVAELSLLLGMGVSVGELQRCPTYKEKVRKQPDNVNVGLFTYPVLMAADILIQKANIVPVGEDQLPHIELTKDFAQRFNHRFGETFPIPEALMERAVRVPGLDGSGKMGKSDGNTIDLSDDQSRIMKKIAGAVTDTTRIRKGDHGHPYDCNLFAIHEFVNTPECVADIKQGCESATLGCVECKRKLAATVVDFLAPFQERRTKIATSPNHVREILYDGGKKAKRGATVTVDDVRTKMGLIRY